MKYDFLTVGGMVEDITFSTSQGKVISDRRDLLRQKLLAFEYGAKIKIDASRLSFGGGAANAAVSFSRLGFKTGIISAAGGDERGQRMLANLKKNKISTNLVERKKTESGFSFILTGLDGEHIVFSSRGASAEISLSSREEKELQKANWIYISSLSGKWLAVLNKVFANKKGRIAWNPGQVQLSAGAAALAKFLKKTDILIVNKDEATELVLSLAKYKAKKRAFFSSLENLAKAIKDLGPKTVVITAGENGAIAFAGREFFRQPIIKNPRPINTIGVGDAFASSFVAGWEIYRGDLKKAMLLAARNSSSVVGRFGAQAGLLFKKDLLK